MQIHHLQLSAVGPFAGTHHIDFMQLNSAGIFLLEGPTGAGKSTLIDAVVFGLYGKVASSAASDDRIRSALVPESRETYVDLVFETGMGIYRVRRTPERMRPKKRGTGLIKEQATVKLWRLSTADLESLNDKYATAQGITERSDLDIGELRSTRMDETGLEIQRAIGLDRTQFVQTIVLPQGEFASFLRADPEQRRLLLQKVFGTEIYESAQQELSAMRREANREIEAGQTELDRAKTAFITAADLTPEQGAALDQVASDELLDAVTGICQELTATAATATEQAATSRRLADGAQLSWEKAKKQVVDFTRRKALLLDQDRLTQTEPEITGVRAQIEAANRAAVVLPILNAQVRAAGTLEKTKEELLQASAHAATRIQGLETLDPAAEISPEDLTQLQERARSLTKDLRARLGKLDHLLALEKQLPTKSKQVAEGSEKIAQQQSELDELRQSLAGRPEQLQDLTAHQDHVAQRAQRSERDAENLKNATARIAAFAAADRTLEDLEKARNELTAKQGLAKARITTEAGLRQARIDQIAGELGQQLQPNQPCMVCGSMVHPLPAILGDDAVSPEQISAAQSDRLEAEDQLVRAQQEVTQLQERSRSQQEVLSGSTNPQALQDLRRAQDQATDSNAAAHELPHAQAAVSEFETQTQRLQQQAAALETKIGVDTAKLAHQEADLVSDRTTVAAALGESAAPELTSLTQVVGHLNNQEHVLEQVLNAIGSFCNAREHNEAQEKHVAQILVEQEFATAQLVHEAALPASDIQQLNKAVTTHTQAVIRVSTELNSPDLKQLPTELDVDLTVLEAAAAVTKENAHLSAQLATTKENQAVGAARQKDAIAICWKEVGETLTRVEPIVRMANITAGAPGDNTKNLTLQTYVLMKRFEEVIDLANVRLSDISDGRYELQRSDEREDVRTRRTGLALKVIDHNVDSSRDPRTLSGGETFYVSLCLALGLADVVTAEAGGVELGTLFIDEGFGSLDSETLDAVLQVLGTLRSGGRTVGVVSHVDALKQTILDGISVRHLPAGGSTLTVRA